MNFQPDKEILDGQAGCENDLIELLKAVEKRFMMTNRRKL